MLSTKTPARTPEKLELLANAILARVEPTLPLSERGKFILIAVDSGAFEIDSDELAAFKRLNARCPEEEKWMARVGCPTAYEFKSPRLR